MAKNQNGLSRSEESGSVNGLTPIHQRIHCAATPDTIADANELDVIAREIFIDTLAEVALAIARRKIELET